MLLALWPLFTVRRQQTGGLISPDITHREIRGKEVIKRTPAMIAAETHLTKLQAEAIRGADNSDTRQSLDLARISGSIEPVGNVAVRIPRHERELSGSVPAALGASIAASDAVSFSGLNEAMNQYAARQAADEDDEMAIITIMMGTQ